MDQKSIDITVKTLNQLKEQGLNFFNIPSAIWKAIHQITTVPSVEVLVTEDGQNFLLTFRDDDTWHGWHIPGGFMNHGETITQTCSRVSQRELGIKVKLERVIEVSTRVKHPFASPLSVVCLCTTNQKPKEGQFLYQIPTPIISGHKQLIETFLKQKKTIKVS